MRKQLRNNPKEFSKNEIEQIKIITYKNRIYLPIKLRKRVLDCCSSGFAVLVLALEDPDCIAEMASTLSATVAFNALISRANFLSFLDFFFFFLDL